ncbi:MAG: diphthine--ammonia ligase [Planctomycetota bacterium]
MRLLSSWSGGKDSALACYKALSDNNEIVCLVNFISKEYKRCCFHGTEAKLISLQAELTGIPLFQKEVTADMIEYENEFKSAVKEVKQKYNAEGMVFGDIYLDEHREWVERVCGEIGITPVEPLWNKSTADIIAEFINDGFRAVVVSCKADILGRDFVGRYIDTEFVRYLQERNICLCGENGEFHTFLVDAPFFNKKIEITCSEPVLKKGFWEHWFLDIQKWEVKSK